ncbi:hypothetical protein OHD51_21685 [Escherichia coli]|uniref:hypothetical protein n=1 Tax=Escherichia coli TaxID=562 RepID=UPI00201A39CB|nr:hypothetical protein [Escherichia coli]MCW7120842.1 hypothetical protein [Escherichia coli]MCW7422978.1 hypothetical protein [Escherichia coli]
MQQRRGLYIHSIQTSHREKLLQLPGATRTIKNTQGQITTIFPHFFSDKPTQRNGRDVLCVFSGDIAIIGLLKNHL